MPEAETAPGALELDAIMGRLALVSADERMAIARRLLRSASGDMYDPSPASRLLDHLRELAQATDQLPPNGDIALWPGLRGRDITALLRSLRAAGAIAVTPGAGIGATRTFRILD